MDSRFAAEAFAHEEQLLIPEWLLLKDGPVRGHAVVVSQGRFKAVGPTVALKMRFPDIATTELADTLLMPGFVDTHHHLTQSFGKSLVFGEPSEIFRRVWVPLEGCLNEEHLYLASKLSALEALRGGFTTVSDAGTRADASVGAIAKAATDAGLRCVLGLICNDLGGIKTPQRAEAIVERAEQHIARWESDRLIHPSLAISIPEAATDGMLTKISNLCAEAGCAFQTHVNEHLAAVERSIEQRKLRPIEHLHRVGALGPQALLAHATLVTPTEIKMLCDSGAAVSYNPVASAWKGNAVAPAHLMTTLGIRLGLGTDGTRSDGFRLLDYAEAAQRFAFGLGIGDSSCGGGWTWMEHATFHGAQALGLDSVTGEIAAGKDADFLLVDLNVPEMQPSWDLTWELVRLANRDQIMGVFVAGKLRLWQGWPVDWDAKLLMAQVAQVAKTVVAEAPITKLHGFASEHRFARTGS
ncbi:amidohydrolase family protein [Noviherbaspirillum saxi]|uniref:Amidohydrolase n=1 Tax=Noviherbaspirillum saxi TaxID=2320863 RepID=A0A3A3G310_9BURK|nr:amidohydrolase family protein [Noviherbaspirillum saxi]RJF92453.1 amidohydrolase [Noviherbaspirillum saxi]